MVHLLVHLLVLQLVHPLVLQSGHLLVHLLVLLFGTHSKLPGL